MATITAPSVIYASWSPSGNNALFINDISFSGNSEDDSALVEIVQQDATWSLTDNAAMTGNGTSTLTFTAVNTIADINSTIADAPNPDPNTGQSMPALLLSDQSETLSISFTDFVGGTQQSANTTIFIAVNAATSTLTATPSPGSVTLSGAAPVTLTDSATISGGVSPTGTITFTLFENGGSTPVDTETVVVNGNGTYATPTGYTLPSFGTTAGTYQWDVAYSGDDNNQPASDSNNPGEQVTVAAASPTLSATPNPTTVTPGANPVTLTDTAVLSGGFNPTGTITFTLFENGGGSPVDTETVVVIGNGSYSTPTGYTLSTTTGIYQWDVTYSGDTNNNGANDINSPTEQVTVGYSPTLSATPNPTTVTLGANPVTLTDTADLSGGFNPTGTITFTLFENGGGSPVDTETVVVNGDGSYSTPVGYTLPSTGTVTGTYQWDATYSGDANNNAASDINSPTEQVTVLPEQPPNAAPPAGTKDTLVMRRNADGAFEFYNIGRNTVLLSGPLGQINPALQVADVGGFDGSDTADLLMRNPTSGVFTLYDVSNNNIIGNVALGAVGLEWQVAGFGDFSGKTGETDMLLRNSNTGAFEVYDISDNAITSAGPMGDVGLNWTVAGFGDFSGNASETDMLLRNSNTGAFEVYDISKNAITSAAPMGDVGLNWAVAGFGDFSGNANETDMLMQNTSTGAFEVYDISNNAITFAGPMGQVGLNWTVAGFGEFSGNANETDMLLRNSNTGAFEVYDISKNVITSAAPMGDVGTEWSISGVSANSSNPSPSTLLSGPAGAAPGSALSQLTQAMASFAPSVGSIAASSPLDQAAMQSAMVSPLAASTGQIHQA